MRKRITKTTGLVGLFMTIATVSFAYFLAESIFEGEGSTTGSTPAAVTLPLEVKVGGTGIEPGITRQITLYTDNTSGRVVKVKRIEATITTSTPACKPVWFTFHGVTQQDKEFLEGTDEGQEVQQGIHEFSPLEGGYQLTELEEPSEDQSPCANATITVHAKVHS
jgi:hypothetical protein